MEESLWGPEGLIEVENFVRNFGLLIEKNCTRLKV